MIRSFYFLVIFVGSALLLSYLIYPMFLGQLHPIGDYAADMLLANKLTDEGYLLVGHYSRWGFNHPGPFFFYINHFSEFLFGWLPISRWQTWYLGSILINTTFLVYSAIYFSEYLGARHKDIFPHLVILITIGYIGFSIAHVWMPNRIITPYTAFFVSVLHLSKGNFKHLVPASFFTGVLVHGYATMPFLTVPFLIIGALSGCFFYGGLRGLYRHKKYFVTSFIISLTFASPMFLDYFMNERSNLSILLETNSRFASRPKPSAEEMRAVISDLFFTGREYLWIAFLLVATPIIIWVKNPSEEEKKNIIVVTALFTLIFLSSIAYYSTTPKPVYTFSMYFLKSLIPLLISLPLFLVINEIQSSKLFFFRYIERRRALILSLSTLLVVTSIVHTERAASVQPHGYIRNISEEIMPKLDNTNKVILDYSRHDQWRIIAGLMLDLNSFGIESCTTWRHMAFLYTNKHTCYFDDLVPKVKIVPSELCNNSCDFVLNSIGVQFFKFLPVPIGEKLNFDSDKLHLANWHPPESTHRWSDGKLSSIVFKVDSPHQVEGVLKLHMGILGGQKITISLNGTKIYSGMVKSFEWDKFLEVPFDKTLLRNGDDTNTLTFDTPDARQPGNGDPRTLAVALKSFQIR